MPREKVLIVEDDEGVARLQRQRLERIGYAVSVARNCGEAVAIARTGVDMVILDYYLENMTGLEVCEQFWAAGLDPPVVMVTGFSEEATVIKALRCGVRDFIPKSLDYLDYLPLAVARVLQQKQTEKRLQNLEARRQDAQKMEALGQLAGGVAHEFNNLLQIIQGFTTAAMEESADRPEVCEKLEEVMNAASKATTITGQLLAFARCQPVAMEMLDLRVLVTNLIKMMRPVLGRNIKTEVHFDPHLAQVWGSEAMLGQVVMNLCLNARDAMIGGGKLTIECSNVSLTEPLDHVNDTLEPGEYARLRISDTGTGIAPEHLHRLYEPFFTTKPVGQGTGLGLPTVLGVVKEHGGAMEVDSTLGIGTSFTVYLPQFSPVPPPAHSEESASHLGGAR